MYSFSLFQLITKPTRVTSTSATHIDHIWSTEIEGNIGNYVLQSDITDHFPTVSQFSFVHANPEPQFVYKRLVSATSMENFNIDLGLLNWNQVLNSTCCDEAYSLFYDEFYNPFKKHFPIQKSYLNKKNEISPYITPALQRSIKEKHRLERLAKNWPLTFGSAYRQYRNKLTSTLRTAKNLYSKNQFNENQGKPWKQWKTINSLLGRTGNLNKPNIELKPSCIDPSVKFNEHFLKNNSESYEDYNYKKYLKSTQNFSMYLAPTKITEVENVINSIHTNTPGYDDVSPKIVKNSSHLICTPLVHIINLSLKTGTFPDQLKKS